uniref:Conotoxin ar3b n=1 Tax=Conus araneosus TaxID=101286 RepID=CM3B_CONAO|nr:RecName: Full=Conotoxin ar3b; Contains: RecName: Full=Conotoxin ar3a [Conus araneosus]
CCDWDWCDHICTCCGG